MAVREFTDELGVGWRVWDVVPSRIIPAAKGEDYLADMYQTGWIVFETLAGDVKRRLTRVPKLWAEADERELRVLLARAEAVPTRPFSSGRILDAKVLAVRADAPPETGAEEVIAVEVVRTFRYPGGRFWTVCVVFRPADEGGPALRFTAGARSIDLKNWPRDWADYPDERLVDLLREAFPRSGRSRRPGTPHRRWDDPQESNP
jgi:hypothetical protein